MTEPTRPAAQEPPQPQSDRAAPLPAQPVVPHAEFKAILLMTLFGALVLGALLYLLYARGAFDETQRLVLLADDAEGVVVGMDMTFSGFPIGRVRRIELADDGKARMLVDVSRDDAHWLRSSSIFTLEKGIVGGSKLRAFSGILSDPLMKPGETRTLLVGDAAAEIPRVLASVKELAQNLASLTASGSSLESALANVKDASARLNGPGGAVGLLVGDDRQASQLLQRADRLLQSVDKVAARADTLLANTDRRVYGQHGLMGDAQATVVQMNALLTDARNSMKQVDAVLAEAQAVGANARIATQDLGALRGEVDSNLRRIEQLVNEINRKWPFARNPEIKLP